MEVSIVPRMHYFPSIQMWQYTWNIVNLEISCEPRCPEFLLSPHHMRAWFLTYVIELNLQQSPGGWPKGPTLNHMVGLDGVANFHSYIIACGCLHPGKI